MCLGVPGRVIEVRDFVAIVDFWGVRKEVRLDIVDEPVAPGDYILNHVGFAIRRISPEAVSETLALFVDKVTLREFLAKRVSAEEFTNRAKFTLFDGLDPVGRVPIEVWADSFNSTYKATNIAPPKGAICP